MATIGLWPHSLWPHSLWPHLLWQANIYAVLTILATIWILPITFAMEPPAMVMKTVNAALGTGGPYRAAAYSTWGLYGGVCRFVINHS